MCVFVCVCERTLATIEKVLLKEEKNKRTKQMIEKKEKKKNEKKTKPMGLKKEREEKKEKVVLFTQKTKHRGKKGRHDASCKVMQQYHYYRYCHLVVFDVIL